MKKNIFTIILLLAFCLNSYSQKRKESRDKIKSLKIAYITQQLNLSNEEAQVFWPIYNKHDEAIFTLRNELKAIIRTPNLGNISNEEAKKLIENKNEIDQKILNENQSFVNQLEKILSYQKILKLQITELEFGRKLIQKYKGVRKG